MKYLVILGDGMADYPLAALGDKTPLAVAQKPNIDRLCREGELGLVRTVPDGMKPGSDVANLSVMGYAPDKFYTGRSPLEALSIGIDLAADDVAVRCNLVTLSDEAEYADKTMVDYSAGEIGTDEARVLIEYLQTKLGESDLRFYTGVSYRHCTVLSHAQTGTEYTPPHDISDRVIGAYLPKGRYGDRICALMRRSYELLREHPVNLARIAQGKRPANSIWLWGEGTRPALEDFRTKFGLRGAVISAVDLLKGIGKGARMRVIEVPNATGTYHTDFAAKARFAADALEQDCDYVYLHMEAADECGHQGDVEHKVLSIERIDSRVVGYLRDRLDEIGEPYRILLMPDHPTPCALKTHVSDPVPYILYRSDGKNASGAERYDEAHARASGIYYADCMQLIDKFIRED